MYVHQPAAIPRKDLELVWPMTVLTLTFSLLRLWLCFCVGHWSAAPQAQRANEWIMEQYFFFSLHQPITSGNLLDTGKCSCSVSLVEQDIVLQAFCSSYMPPLKPENNSWSALFKVVGISSLSNSCSDFLSPHVPSFSKRTGNYSGPKKIYVKTISSDILLTPEKLLQKLVWLHYSSFPCKKWNNLCRPWL